MHKATGCCSFFAGLVQTGYGSFIALGQTNQDWARDKGSNTREETMKARNEVNLPPSWRREVRPREAAAMIGCSQAFVYKLMKDGRFRKPGDCNAGTRGIRLIDRSGVEAFLCGQGSSRLFRCPRFNYRLPGPRLSICCTDYASASTS